MCPWCHQKGFMFLAKHHQNLGSEILYHPYHPFTSNSPQKPRNKFEFTMIYTCFLVHHHGGCFRFGRLGKSRIGFVDWKSRGIQVCLMVDGWHVLYISTWISLNTSHPCGNWAKMEDTEDTGCFEATMIWQTIYHWSWLNVAFANVFGMAECRDQWTK